MIPTESRRPLIYPVLRSLFERLCLLGWMIYLMTVIVLVGLAVELLALGGVFAFWRVTPLDSGSLEFVGCGLIAFMNFPVLTKTHAYGVTHLNFALHENNLNHTMAPTGTLFASLMIFLDKNQGKSSVIERMLSGIIEAEEIGIRQERRLALKAWVWENRHDLDEEEIALVMEHASYLISSSWFREKE